MLKLVDENDKTYTVERHDGEKITIAKMAGDPLYAGLTQKVPGVAKVSGDSPKNDTVDISVSPGELIIPRTHSGDLKSAVAFLKTVPQFANGGKVEGDDETDGGDDDYTTSDAVPMALKPKKDRQKYPSGGFAGEAPFTPASPPAIEDDEEETATQAPLVAVPNMGVTAPNVAPPPLVNPGVTTIQDAPIADGVQPPPTDVTKGEPTAPAKFTLGETRDETKGIQAPTEKDLKRSTKAVVDGIVAEGEAKAAGHKAEKEELEKYGRQIAFENREAEINDTIRRTRFAQRQEAHDKLVDKYTQATRNGIDPGHLWADEGGGNRALAAIGIALGAIGQGLNGKENGAIKIIDQAIDRDIAIQKANLAQLGDSTEASRGGLKDFRDLLGSEEAAENSLRLARYGEFKNRFDIIAANTASTESKAAAQRGSAEMTNKMDQLKAQANTYNHIETEKDMLPKAPQMADNVDIRTYNELNTSYNEVKRLRNQYKEILEKGGSGLGMQAYFQDIARSLGVDDTKVSSLRANIIGALANKTHTLSGTGAAEKEVKRLSDTFPKLTDKPETALRIFDDILGEGQRRIEAAERSYEGTGHRLTNRTADFNTAPSLKRAPGN
jgi:hypothetical protein